MVNMSKRKSVAIAALVTMALVLAVALPSVAYAADDLTQTQATTTRVLLAKGFAFERIDGEVEKTPTNLTLVLEPGKISNGIITFSIVGGEVNIDGKVYTVTEGKGFVAYRKRIIAMQFNGTAPEGETFTVKLGGRYFWMWGRVHVARLAGSLQTDGSKLGLLLRAVIRPEA